MSEYEKLVESLRSYSTEVVSYKIDGAFAYAVTAAADAIEQLSTKCRQLEKERDAAVADLKECCDCGFCIRNHDMCDTCFFWDKWQWRGVGGGKWD